MNVPVRIAEVLERLEETRWRYYNLHPTAAKILAILAKASEAKTVVEVGSANGYSAIVLGAAVRGHGGRVFTIERDSALADEAVKNVLEAGLQDVVTVIPGSAFKALRDLQGPWDLAFLDGTKQEYAGYLERILPKLSPKALLVADNLLSHPEELADFREQVHNHPHIDATILPVGTGLLVGLYDHAPAGTSDERRTASLRELIAAAAPAVREAQAPAGGGLG